MGVFDSGLGGLSVLKALERRLPMENYIYFGDTARAPYGDRSSEEIRRFNLEIGGWLLDQQCKMLLIACNTSTVLGMETLKASTDKPVFGMMEAILADALPGEGPMGFIATQGTVESGAYQRAFAAAAPEMAFFPQACPDFVPLVEQGRLDDPAVDEAVAAYLTPLRDKGIRTLILGCTHYPILAPAIAAFLGAAVRLADPADAMARIVADYMASTGIGNDGDGDDGGDGGDGGGSGTARGSRAFYCSGDRESFRAKGSAILGRPLGEIGRQVFP